MGTTSHRVSRAERSTRGATVVARGRKKQAGLGLVCVCGGTAALGSRSQWVTGTGVAVTGERSGGRTHKACTGGHHIVTGSFFVSQSPGASLGGAVTEQLETVAGREVSAVGRWLWC